MLEKEKEEYQSIHAPERLRQKINEMEQKKESAPEKSPFYRRPQVWVTVFAVCVILVAAGIRFGGSTGTLSVLINQSTISSTPVLISANTDGVARTIETEMPISIEIEAKVDGTGIMVTDGILQLMRDTIEEYPAYELNQGEKIFWQISPKDSTKTAELQVKEGEKTAVYELYQEEESWYLRKAQ